MIITIKVGDYIRLAEGGWVYKVVNIAMDQLQLMTKEDPHVYWVDHKNVLKCSDEEVMLFMLEEEYPQTTEISMCGMTYFMTTWSYYTGIQQSKPIF